MCVWMFRNLSRRLDTSRKLLDIFIDRLFRGQVSSLLGYEVLRAQAEVILAMRLFSKESNE